MECWGDGVVEFGGDETPNLSALVVSDYVQLIPSSHCQQLLAIPEF
jgi:hypothetical protein